MAVNLAEARRFAESEVDPEYKAIIDAVIAAKPIIDRADRFEHGDTVDCNCNMCTEDRAARAAFAGIDFSGVSAA